MKRQFLFLAFLMISTGFYAQNLVPNPSFEEYIDCPWSSTELHPNCVDWYSFAVTPDYFNACSENVAGVPSNAWGYQDAITGDAYAALITYTHSFVDAREYIAAPLASVLEPGNNYYVMFYVSLYDGGVLGTLHCSTNRIGAKFFANADYSPDNPYLPENNADVEHNELLSDTSSWVLIDGWFEADQEYYWVAIGNFYDDTQTDTLQLAEPGKCYGIYYIENVCIATDPKDCDYLKQESDISSVDDPDQQETTIQVFPNPSPGWFQIKATAILTEVKVYNAIGQLISDQYVNQQELNLDGTNWSQGLYILKVKDENNDQHTIKVTKH